MPQDPFIREKFTKERNAARKHAAEYFERFPKERYQTEIESLAPSAIAKYRIHHEATARADRVRWLTRLLNRKQSLPCLVSVAARDKLNHLQRSLSRPTKPLRWETLP